MMFECTDNFAKVENSLPFLTLVLTLQLTGRNRKAQLGTMIHPDTTQIRFKGWWRWSQQPGKLMPGW